jgi:excisionase family DNA binding protein
MSNSQIIMSTYTLGDIETVFRDCIKSELQSFRPQPSIPEDDLITEQEAKKMLLVSKVTLKKWRDEGRIKFYRIGSRIRYRKSDLLKSLETSTKKGRGSK